MEKEYDHYVMELRSQNPELAQMVADWKGLRSVLSWMEQLSLPSSSIDLIGQDEFEYDFLIALHPSTRWLVFGVT